MLHLLASNIGVANKWSTSIKIAARRIKITRFLFSLKNRKPIRMGTIKCIP